MSLLGLPVNKQCACHEPEPVIAACSAVVVGLNLPACVGKDRFYLG